MEDKTSNSSGKPTNGSPEKSKLINRSRIADIRRQLKGAEKRITRLEQELSDVRSILKRGYIEETDAKDTVTQIPLKPFDRDTYRNKRVLIEQELTLAKRDYLVSDRAYKKAINNNFQVNKLKLAAEKKENGIRRIAKNLARKTVELVKQQESNGGAEKFKVLKSLAEASDAKGFREAFDKYGPELNQELYYTVSGVNEVKTDILHELMEQLAKKKADSPEVTEAETK